MQCLLFVLSPPPFLNSNHNCLQGLLKPWRLPRSRLPVLGSEKLLIDFLLESLNILCKHIHLPLQNSIGFGQTFRLSSSLVLAAVSALTTLFIIPTISEGSTRSVTINKLLIVLLSGRKEQFFADMSLLHSIEVFFVHPKNAQVSCLSCWSS